MKDSVAFKTLDNITVVLLAFNNLKTTLSNEFEANRNPIDEKDGQVGGSMNVSEDQQRATNNDIALANQEQNAVLDCTNSANGGLQMLDNRDVQTVTKDDIARILSLPNIDLSIDDVQTMVKKPKMPHSLGSS
jgi:hypothetical protein